MANCNSCILTQGFNDTSSYNPANEIHYVEVYRSPIIHGWLVGEYHCKNHQALRKVVNSLIRGYQPNISVRLALAENLIKANTITHTKKHG